MSERQLVLTTADDADLEVVNAELVDPDGRRVAVWPLPSPAACPLCARGAQPVPE